MAIIDVMVEGVTAYLDDGTPYVIGGFPSLMDTDDLTLKTYTLDRENDVTDVTEYWEEDQLRHRTVSCVLKQGLGSDIMQAIFG